MKRPRFSQQVIVVLIFVLMFTGFALFVPGFLNRLSMVALLQNVAILGILGLGMAVIVLGRGIDLSMVATLAVSPGLPSADGPERAFRSSGKRGCAGSGCRLRNGQLVPQPPRRQAPRRRRCRGVQGDVYVLSKGSRRILQLPVAATERLVNP